MSDLARAEALIRARQPGLVLWLTGAGISAPSGIPTFRGPEGYWRVGSRNYHPQELATRSAFEAMPWEVWGWYLYRRSVCRAAEPNAAHRALAEYARAAAEGALLVTQNVDGLHARAGHPRARMYAIHGEIDFARCAEECSPTPFPMPEGVPIAWPKGELPGPEVQAMLVCPRCGGRARPHVLWFDESYDEPRFRFESSLEAAGRASLFIVVGTAGATNLPIHIGSLCARRGVPSIVVDPNDNPFATWARESGGVHLAGDAANDVPALCNVLMRNDGAASAS